ncbi:MAG: LysM peptidoglycan-binding domain-containing protein [Heteroscytonema crispum UTEX LB 1556]
MVDTQDIWHKKSRGGFVSENPLSSAQPRAANPLSSARPHASATSTQTKPQPLVPSRTPTVSLRRGDTLWEVAQKKLGDGTRWHELRKADGNRFTAQEARRLQVGTQVHLPGAKITTETPHPVTLRSSTPRVSTQVLRPEGITRREFTPGSTPSTRSTQFNASPALFSRTSQVSLNLLSAEGMRREWNNAQQPQPKPQPVQLSKATQLHRQGERNLINNPSKAQAIAPLGEQNNNNALNQISSVVTGTAVGIKTKEFFLGRRLEKDPRALALAERKIEAKLGDNGMKAFRRISDLKSPREAYAVLRHYIDHASKIPGSEQLLSDLGSRSTSTAKGAVGEIRQIPKSKLRRSRIERVADRFEGRQAADRVYKNSLFLQRKTVVDVKEYDFTKKFYQGSYGIDKVNKRLDRQVARYRRQFPGSRTKIKYEFVGSGRVPREIVNNLRDNGVKVKVPIRVKALEAARAVGESKVANTTLRAARAVGESKVVNTTLRAARAVGESKVANTTLHAARAVGESRAANTTLRAARAVGESRAANTTLRAARVVGESKAASVVLRGASRVAAPVAVGLDAWQLKNAYQKDGFGKEFRKTAGSVAGAWGGAAAGAAIGSAIFPGVGTVVGGAIGGIAGSAWGDDIEQGAEKAGKAIAGGAKKAWNKLFG